METMITRCGRRVIYIYIYIKRKAHLPLITNSLNSIDGSWWMWVLKKYLWMCKNVDKPKWYITRFYVDIFFRRNQSNPNGMHTVNIPGNLHARSTEVNLLSNVYLWVWTTHVQLIVLYYVENGWRRPFYRQNIIKMIIINIIILIWTTTVPLTDACCVR